MIGTQGTDRTGETFTRVAVKLGSGKVHYAHKYEGWAVSPACGGNRASERYRVTGQDVDCKRCLKVMAKEEAAEQAHLDRVEASMMPATESHDLGYVAEPAEAPACDAVGCYAPVDGEGDLCGTCDPADEPTAEQHDAVKAGDLVKDIPEDASVAELEEAETWLADRLAKVRDRLAAKRAVLRPRPVKVYLDHTAPGVAVALMVGGHGLGDDPQIWLTEGLDGRWDGVDDYDEDRRIEVRRPTARGCVLRWIAELGLDVAGVAIETRREF